MARIAARPGRWALAPAGARLLGALVATATMTAAAAGVAGEAQGLGAIAGSWRGPVVENTLGAPLAEARAELAVDGRAVAARWTTLGEGETRVRLAPSARPEVLAPVAPGGLAAMFGGGEPPRPLEGEPLVWGRAGDGSGGDGLSIYRLAISREGRPTLDRYAFAPGASGLDLTVSRLGAGGEVVGRLRAELRRERP